MIDFADPTLSPQAFGGLLHTVTVSVLLAVSLVLNVPLNSSLGSPASQKLQPTQLEETSDSVLQDSSPQSDLNASPPNTPMPALTDGTPVHLKFGRAVVSSQVIAGERVALEVVDQVLVGNLIAISPHAPAEATVTVAQAKRSMGRGGNLELKIESVRLADGELVPLRAVKDVKGGDNQPALLTSLGTAGLMYWAASPLVFLFYVKGKSATVPAGTEITAYTAGEFPLDPSKFRAADASPREKSAPK
jgi:hypothetical protein